MQPAGRIGADQGWTVARAIIFVMNRSDGRIGLSVLSIDRYNSCWSGYAARVSWPPHLQGLDLPVAGKIQSLSGWTLGKRGELRARSSGLGRVFTGRPD